MEASQTALIAAFARAYHATHDASLIFNDFLAWHLFTRAEIDLFERNLAESLKFFEPEAIPCADPLAQVMQRQIAPITLSRSRYTEDLLGAALQEGTQQYVILGRAGHLCIPPARSRPSDLRAGSPRNAG